jgi:hypothetical protein
MKRVLLGAAALLWAVPALAQVQQSGTVTARHPAYWVTSGAIGDPGGATDSALSSLGVTNEGGAGLCVSSQRASAAGRQQLCLSAGTLTGATVSLTNLGTAPAAPLSFVIDGTTYPFPGSLANITIGVTPVIGGSTSQCLFVSGGVVGQQACSLSAITSLTGDGTATGPGSAVLTLATVNSNVGTFGSGAVVPIITVNGKGLITSVTTSPVSVTIGSSAIVSGSNNGILYDSGGVFGNLSTLANAVLVTSVGGVPSMATTLPSGLTIPSPTFTGTETFPDAATWTSAGISKVAALSTGSATIPAAGNINVSGQYQVSGSQIAASNLSNGTTGSGSVVLAASPTLSGTVAGSITLSGNNTYSGNSTFSAQDINTGTSAPASASGQVYIMGTIAVPTLANTGQGAIYDTVAGGLNVQGDGSASDFTLRNAAGTTVFTVPTGTTKLNVPSLSVGTCSAGLALDIGNNTVLTSCPGASASIQVGTTSITSGASGSIEFNNVGVLGELVPNGGVTKSGSNLQQDGNYGGWALQNCTLAASVGSNLLTVALKDNAGNDPSAASPCNINYRNVTAATGSTTLVQQTAALSMTTNATGATLGSSSNTAFRFWVVVFNNSGTNVLALINCSTATQVYPLNEGVVASSTPISGSATAAGTFYTPNGTTVTSKAFRIVGYVEYNSTGLTTAGTYATGPNFIQVFGPGIRKPGELVQKASMTTSSVTSVTSSFATTTVTQAITPTSSANLINVRATGGVSVSGAVLATFTLSRGSTSVGSQSMGPVVANTISSIALEALDNPNTASSVTYAVFGKCGTTLQCAYPVNTNGGTCASGPCGGIVVEEIMGALPEIIPDNDNDPRLTNAVA